MKTRFLLLFIVFLNSSELLFAQVPQWKVETATTVYEDLVNAFGSGSSEPEFVLIPGKKQLVTYYPGEQARIIMDEHVYDICSDLGPDSLNALATLLGHELAHYYKDHDWCSSFGEFLGEDEDLAKKIKKVSEEQKLSVETQADYFGGFYGHVAGYATYAITSKLLNRIYDEYNLPEKIKGYPSKTERKTIAAKRYVELHQWIMLFNAGEYLFALKEYALASICFDFLGKQFPSREMFNNSGVCRIYQVMEHTSMKQMPFILPVEFDPLTRLKDATERTRGASDHVENEERNRLLSESINYFQKAITRDPAYNIGRVNLGCANLLIGNLSMADGIANGIIMDGEPNEQKKSYANAHSLKAIVAWRNDRDNEAKKQFKTSYEYYPNTTAEYNLEALKKLTSRSLDKLLDYLPSYLNTKNHNSETVAEKVYNPASERIGGENAAGTIFTQTAKSLTIPGASECKIGYYPGKDYNVIRFSDKSQQYKFIQTLPEYQYATSQGIKSGSPSSLIKQRYGNPTYVRNTSRGKYFVYKATRIIFQIDDEDNLDKWILFDWKMN